jgi:hypothetical protein
LLCRLLGHRIDRRRVWNDGIDFRTSCPRCGAALLRDHVGWREFDAERDEGMHRLPHPSQDKG